MWPRANQLPRISPTLGKQNPMKAQTLTAALLSSDNLISSCSCKNPQVRRSGQSCKWWERPHTPAPNPAWGTRPRQPPLGQGRTCRSSARLPDFSQVFVTCLLRTLSRYSTLAAQVTFRDISLLCPPPGWRLCLCVLEGSCVCRLDHTEMLN